MSDGQAYKKPLVDSLMGVPLDLRAEWPIHWSAEDGSPTGHAMAPVGRYCHEASERIAELEAALRRVSALNDHNFTLGDAMEIAKAALQEDK